MESILASTKKLLGVAEDNEDFDQEIIMHINTVFLNLTQIGVGPEDGFYIEDDTTEWVDFIGDTPQLQAVKSYMGLKVRLLFDLPPSSSVIESMNRTIDQLEWRLRLAAETFSEEITT